MIAVLIAALLALHLVITVQAKTFHDGEYVAVARKAQYRGVRA
jgi:hypothetical protein